MIKDEKWQAIPKNRMYAVSTLGRVASAAHGVISVLSLCDNGKGYKMVSIKDIKRRNFYVHRLVAQAFIPNPNKHPEVNHIDGDKSNNRVENLEWVTLQQNRDHAVKTGIILRGEMTPAAKLTSAQVLEIVDIMRSNPKENMEALGRRYNVNGGTIRKIIHGQRWAHLTGIKEESRLTNNTI